MLLAGAENGRSHAPPADRADNGAYHRNGEPHCAAYGCSDESADAGESQRGCRQVHPWTPSWGRRRQAVTRHDPVIIMISAISAAIPPGSRPNFASRRARHSIRSRGFSSTPGRGMQAVSRNKSVWMAVGRCSQARAASCRNSAPDEAICRQNVRLRREARDLFRTGRGGE